MRREREVNKEKEKVDANKEKRRTSGSNSHYISSGSCATTSISKKTT